MIRTILFLLSIFITNGASSKSLSYKTNDTKEHRERISQPTFRTEVKKSINSVYETEPFKLTYIIYTDNVDNISVVGGLESNNYFQVQKSSSGWLIDKKYTCSYIVTPLKTGTLRIPPVYFDVSYDGYEEFYAAEINKDPDYDGLTGTPYYLSDGYIDTLAVSGKINIRSEGLSIDVKPLPLPKPVYFSGAIGRDLTIEYALNAPGAKVGDTIKVDVEIGGLCNDINNIKDPIVSFPADFEIIGKYTHENRNGIVYLAIPHSDGTYKLPIDGFTYFDIEDKEYKTIKARTHSVIFNSTNNKYEYIITDEAVIIVERKWYWNLIGIIIAASLVFGGIFSLYTIHKKRKNNNIEEYRNKVIQIIQSEFEEKGYNLKPQHLLIIKKNRTASYGILTCICNGQIVKYESNVMSDKNMNITKIVLKKREFDENNLKIMA